MTDPAREARIERHIAESERRAANLGPAFQLLGEKAKAEPWDAAEGS